MDLRQRPDLVERIKDKKKACRCGRTVHESMGQKIVPEGYVMAGYIMWQCPEPCGSSHFSAQKGVENGITHNCQGKESHHSITVPRAVEDGDR